MKKSYRIRISISIGIKIIMAIIIAYFCFHFAFRLLIPYGWDEITFPVTEEYYNQLEKNALKVAKTLDKNIIEDETLTADWTLNDKELVVTVESIRVKLIAKIPVSIKVLDKSLNLNETIHLENVEYEKIDKMMNSPWLYIMATIIEGIMMFIVVAVLLLLLGIKVIDPILLKLMGFNKTKRTK